MKKCNLVLIISAIFVALLLSSCVGAESDRENDDCSHEWEYATCTQAKECKICGETRGSELGHDWEEATCLLPKTCLRCDIKEGEALGHTSTAGECARCHVKLSSWDSGVYKDEFGNPTSKKYISTTCYDGLFSNSATTNSTKYTIRNTYSVCW